MVEIIQADVMQWARDYDGPKFHACLCDPSFALSKKKAIDRDAPANLGPDATIQDVLDAYHSIQQWGDTGFMQKNWDTDICFDPRTWKAIGEHLHPGAFLLAFGSTRGWHRLACAIEDAGFVIQPSVFVHGVGVVDCAPMIWHVCGQSFPKASRIDTKLDARAKAEREVIGRNPNHRPVSGVNYAGVYAGGNTGGATITAPATPLARAWAGHRYGGQILRDLSLPIVVAQKPWTGKRLDCIVETGAGAFNVDAARVGIADSERAVIDNRSGADDGERDGIYHQGMGYRQAGEKFKSHTSGRWPPNCVFTHHPSCKRVTTPAPCPACSGTGGSDGVPAVSEAEPCEACGGTGSIEVGAVERVKSGPSPYVQQTEIGGYGNTRIGQVKGKLSSHHADPDGTEPISRYRCARHCAGCGCWWLSETADVCPECGEEGEWSCSVRLLDEDGGPSIPRPVKPENIKRSGDGENKGMFGLGSKVQTGYYDKSSNVSRYFPTPDFSHETAERLALGQTRKYAAKPAPREKSAGLERFVWRKRKSGHTRIWSDAAVDQFWHWQQERKGLPGEGFDEWLEACGESKRKIHKIPYTWGNIHPTVKSISLTKWLSTLLLPPDIYAPRRLLIPFCGTFSEGVGALLAGWEHITGIDFDLQACWQSEARARFWTGWSAATGETEVKPILKTARKAQKAQGQTPEPPAAVEPVVEQLQMEAIQ